MEESPLAENTVDLIWLKLEGIIPAPKAISDFHRVLKTSGHIYIEEFHLYQAEKWQKLIGLFDNFTNITPELLQASSSIYTITPKEFADNPVSPEESEKNSIICKDVNEMMDIVSSKHLHNGGELVPRRAVLQKK